MMEGRKVKCCDNCAHWSPLTNARVHGFCRMYNKAIPTLSHMPKEMTYRLYQCDFHDFPAAYEIADPDDGRP